MYLPFPPESWWLDPRSSGGRLRPSACRRSATQKSACRCRGFRARRARRYSFRPDLPAAIAGVKIPKGTEPGTGAPARRIPWLLELHDIFLRFIHRPCFNHTHFQTGIREDICRHAATSAGTHNNYIIFFGLFFYLEVSHTINSLCSGIERQFTGNHSFSEDFFISIFIR